MPTLKCASCGRDTNTAVSDHIDRHDGKASRCYAAHVPDVGWVKGCAYDDASEFMRRFVDRMISKDE